MVKVSVLMPVYNSEKFLSEAIESILIQTFHDFELIIINDGSTDASRKIILSYEDSRIKYYENEFNKGLIYSLNKGIDLCMGKYIARMDADDISIPERLKKQVDFLEAHHDIAVVGSTTLTMINDTKRIDTFYEEKDQQIKSNLIFSCNINHPSVMMRNEIFDTGIRYSDKYTHAEDYYLWYELTEKGYKFYNIREPLIIYRIHQNNVTIENADVFIKTYPIINAKYLSHFFPEIVSYTEARNFFEMKGNSLLAIIKRKKMIRRILESTTILDKKILEQHLYLYWEKTLFYNKLTFWYSLFFPKYNLRFKNLTLKGYLSFILFYIKNFFNNYQKQIF